MFVHARPSSNVAFLSRRTKCKFAPTMFFCSFTLSSTQCDALSLDPLQAVRISIASLLQPKLAQTMHFCSFVWNRLKCHCANSARANFNSISSLKAQGVIEFITCILPHKKSTRSCENRNDASQNARKDKGKLIQHWVSRKSSLVRMDYSLRKLPSHIGGLGSRPMWGGCFGGVQKLKQT